MGECKVSSVEAPPQVTGPWGKAAPGKNKVLRRRRQAIPADSTVPNYTPGPEIGKLAKCGSAPVGMLTKIAEARRPKLESTSPEGDHNIRLVSGDLLSLSPDGAEGFVSSKHGLFRVGPEGVSICKGNKSYNYDPFTKQWSDPDTKAITALDLTPPDVRWENDGIVNPVTGFRYGIKNGRPFYQKWDSDPVLMRLRKKVKSKYARDSEKKEVRRRRVADLEKMSAMTKAAAVQAAQVARTPVSKAPAKSSSSDSNQISEAFRKMLKGISSKAKPNGVNTLKKLTPYGTPVGAEVFCNK